MTNTWAPRCRAALTMPNTDRVRTFSRPALLGGPIDARPDVLTVRWYGTSHPEQGKNLRALSEARAVWESDRPPLSEEEIAWAEAGQKRGSWDPAVFTEGTMCLILQVGDFTIVYRDSAGPVSEEERAYFGAH